MDTEVFGRSSATDARDSVVRVQEGRRRTRLGNYADEGKTTSITLCRRPLHPFSLTPRSRVANALTRFRRSDEARARRPG